MTRTRITLTLTTAGLAGLLGLTACAQPRTSDPAQAPTTQRLAEAAPDSGLDAGLDSGLGDAVKALAAVGFDTALVATAAAPDAPGPSATPSATAGRNGKAGPARRLLRRNTLHGEVTLQTKKGVSTVAAQRGTVTSVGASTVTVKSTDGFTATWSFGEKLRVVKDHQAVDRRTVIVGTQVGIAGAKVQAGPVARLIVVSK